MPKLAKEADVTVLVLGTDLTVAREGHDAVNISFSAGQLALVDAACRTSSLTAVASTTSADGDADAKRRVGSGAVLMRTSSSACSGNKPS